ncbi:hypothetical protein HRbin15_01518 [bacterium HR15]|nr:hypothetical protein HRbin15_01518 [bacterium HR15]
MRRLFLSILAMFLLITLVLVKTRCLRENQPPEGVFIFAVETRPPDQPLAGIRSSIRKSTGRGLWKVSFKRSSQQTKLIQPCTQEPWCANTDSKTHIVLGCGKSGRLYDIQHARSWRMEIPLGKRLIALSLREKFAIWCTKDKVFVASYRITNNSIVWTQERVLPNMPIPQVIHFSPTGRALLMESGGWTYLLPAIGQEARKVFQARALGWTPSGASVFVYDKAQHEILRYDLRHDRISVINLSGWLPKDETPVIVSPCGDYILTEYVSFDFRRFLPEIKTFRIRSMVRQGVVVAEFDTGWGVKGICWLGGCSKNRGASDN